MKLVVKLKIFALQFVMIIFISCNLISTIVNTNYYPFTSFNMFSKQYNHKFSSFYYRLINYEGTEYYSRVEDCIPIEFFRVNHLL